MTGLEAITTDAFVEIYESSSPIFASIFKEIRELSKKKPDATINVGKVKIINRILNDLLVILRDEPAGKYLELLEDQSLPQLSDAVLLMVQFESALDSFYNRYNHPDMMGARYWNTKDRIGGIRKFGRRHT
jgi:hypothetical protein